MWPYDFRKFSEVHNMYSRTFSSASHLPTSPPRLAKSRGDRCSLCLQIALLCPQCQSSDGEASGLLAYSTQELGNQHVGRRGLAPIQLLLPGALASQLCQEH